MPRMARIESPGSLFHVMAHSVSNTQLFIDDDDRFDFLSRFEKGLKKCEFQCYAWALMDNHYHFLLRTSHLPLHKLMRSLNGGYASRYNRKYKRRGYLFQNRFKSILCQEQGYVVRLIKYIHLNPLRAGKVNSLEELGNYQWCGHGSLIGSSGALGQNFQNREQALRFFGANEWGSISDYLKSMSESCISGDHEIAGILSAIEATEFTGSCKGLPSVIGDPDFVKRALENYKGYLNRIHRKADYPVILKRIESKVCEKYSLKSDELKKRGRMDRRTLARADFCYQSHIQELIPLAVIADYLDITIPPVAALVERGSPQAVQRCDSLDYA